jgi:ribosome-associated toxin RatA of RatAB toxin-antitoxin module
MTESVRSLSFELGAMPTGRQMCTVDERVVHSTVRRMFEIASDVERWPLWLPHYRFVRYTERQGSRGIVEMSANRPFGAVNWPTWWESQMEIDSSSPAIRFRHIGGITTGMDVVWQFESIDGDVRVRIVHVWDGPRWPLVGSFAATRVIGPIFVHGIASRTLTGLAAIAEQGTLEGAG